MITKQKTALCTITALFLAATAAGCSVAGSRAAPAPVAEATAPLVTATPVAETTAPVAPTVKLPAAPATEQSAPSQPATPATVEITEITDDQLAQYPAYDEVDVATDEYGFQVLLTTDQPVQDLRLFRLAWDDASQEMAEAYDGTLYQQIEFTANEPLVIKLSIPGTMPTVGVEFTDTDGMIRVYHIIMSGEDGSMHLQEASAG